MFAGHVGVALAIGRAERRVNVGVFVGAALLLDLLLWSFILLGWESVAIPADFARTHQAEFVFPYSHGLMSSLAWSVATGAAALFLYSRLQTARWRAAVLLAAAVFSHWLLDVLVHRPELPLLGAGSTAFGLGLWNNPGVALFVEAAIVLAGLRVFLARSGLSRARSVALASLAVAIVAFTIAGMTIAPAPPSAEAMAGSSLVTLVVICVLCGWLGRAPRIGPT